MDVYCPVCGKKGRIDDAKIPDSGIFARCPGCKKRLWVNKTDGVSLAEEPSSRIPSEGSEQHDSTVPPEPIPAPASPAQAASPQQKETAAGMTEPPSMPPVPSGPPVPPPSEIVPAVPVQPPQPSAPPGPVPEPGAGFDLTPLPAIQAQPGFQPPSEEQTQGIQCSVCSNVFPSTDMVRFGDTMVCAGCKPQYVQMVRSGVSKPGTFRYGGFWIRFVAKFIDGMILGIAQGILIIPLYIYVFKSATTTPGPQIMATFATANIFINIISIAFGATYTTLFIGKYGATPGKMAFGLKVVAPDGGRISYMRALGRHFAEMVSALILAIGYIMAGFDSQKRSLHDRICATRVIRN